MAPRAPRGVGARARRSRPRRRRASRAPRARGYEAHAVDCRDADAVRALGLAPADLVVAGEVIEHLDDCGPFLDGLHALVAPGGMLAVTTPNGASLTNALAALVNLEVNHPDHVVSFTSHTLDTMLRRHGWEPVEHAVFVYEVKIARRRDRPRPDAHERRPRRPGRRAAPRATRPAVPRRRPGRRRSPRRRTRGMKLFERVVLLASPTQKKG